MSPLKFILSLVALPFLVPFTARADTVDAACAKLSRPSATVVYAKAAKLLCVYRDGVPVFSTPASYGRVEGAKTVANDLKTPEGRYTLSPARKSSRFGSFLAISYPDAQQAASARALGQSPGGSVGVHGPMKWYAFLGDWQALVNHSEGCIVVSEAALARLRELIRKPVVIDILAAK